MGLDTVNKWLLKIHGANGNPDYIVPQKFIGAGSYSAYVNMQDIVTYNI